jgi:hypothetical protein
MLRSKTGSFTVPKYSTYSTGFIPTFSTFFVSSDRCTL